MARRIYYMNPKRRLVLQEALAQMRETRDALGPEMLARLELLVKDFDPSMLEENVMIRQDNTVKSEMEPVDRHKNLLIVMKFLQMKQDNKKIQNQVRMFLAENQSL